MRDRVTRIPARRGRSMFHRRRRSSGRTWSAEHVVHQDDQADQDHQGTAGRAGPGSAVDGEEDTIPTQGREDDAWIEEVGRPARARVR